MAATLVKVVTKLAVGGFALYGLSEVLSSQDNTIRNISMLDSKTRENIPVTVSLPEMPSQTKIKHSWNSGVQWIFSGLEQAPNSAWELGTRGAHNAKSFVEEQLK
ncbi:uncharacterized protein [Montipora capricornis]|uniref:uncharacterized protein n=1 Tax=Montipora capricornis TaxID=246305 RepID=UPI0035F10330